MPRSVRLSKRSDPQTAVEDAIIPKAGRKAVTPEQALYGIFGPQYASVLTASAQGGLGETARIADRIELRSNARREAERYSRDLEAANAAQAEMADRDAYYGLLGSTNRDLQGDVELGMGGVRGAPRRNEYGLWETPIDQTRVNVANANVLNTDQAERYSKYSGAVGQLAKDTGIIPETGYISQLLTPPTQATPVPLKEGFKSPDLQVKEYGTSQGLTAEQQMEIESVKAAARASGDDIEVSVKTGTGGDVADVTYKGSPEALERNGIDPATGKKMRPNVGTQGGGVPTEPAAEVRPIGNARKVTEQLWPGVHITEAHRDPSSNLGKKNPKSWHVRTNAAVDVRPSSLPKGTTYEQFVQRFRDAGYPIIEDIDETKHPSKHATGPHWHVVLGERRETSGMYAARLKTSPLVESATPIGDGSVVVRMRDGTQRVYKNGRRVG